MIGPLDMVAAGIRRVLGTFPPDVAAWLSFPVFVVVVVAGSVVFVRKLVPPICRATAIVAEWVITVAGATLLLVEMALATAYRRSAAKPPAVLYGAGDAVVAWAISLANGVRVAAGGAARLARVNVVVMMLLAAGWIWLWNYQHCPDAVGGCTRPAESWYQGIQPSPNARS